MELLKRPKPMPVEGAPLRKKWKWFAYSIASFQANLKGGIFETPRDG